tara:strand:- start:1381 stop:1875 length:495 start_codon:yes stop_codon:yes gene_type:complete
VFDNKLLESHSFNAEIKEVNNLYNVIFDEPFIDHVMKITPYQRIEKWIDENLMTFGTSNKLLINVHEASIKKMKLAEEEDSKKIIKNKEFIYEVTMIVEFELYNDQNNILASTNVRINRTTTSIEFISIAERNRLLDTITLEALKDLNSKSSELLEKHFSQYKI